MKSRIRAVALALASLFTLSSANRLSAQSQSSGDPNDPKFAPFVYDVVSFKPDKPEPNAQSMMFGMVDTPDGFVMQHAGVGLLVTQAYRTEHMQVSGAPTWLNSERYMAEAKMIPEVVEAFNKLSAADQKLARKHMLRILARDYLKLAVHMDSKEVPVYELQIAKGGPKIKETADPSVPDEGMRILKGDGNSYVYNCRNTPLSSMRFQLSATVGRPIFDKTGLTGRYEFKLTFAPTGILLGPSSADAPPSEAPDIMTAIQEQLGLKLVPAKGMMDVLVIDHVERPAMN